ncbi:hypothetical protein KC660_00555, partial [Candidatus Dojkabacteria bacterium]|nr:hypothetical protein [Candidatus Dojkabacteria bacterium]
LVSAGFLYYSQYKYLNVERRNAELAKEVNDLNTQIKTLRAETKDPMNLHEKELTADENEEIQKDINDSTKAQEINLFGEIKRWYQKDGSWYIDFDEKTWLSGSSNPPTCTNAESGSQEAIESGLPECNPNGYEILNTDKKIKTYKVTTPKITVVDIECKTEECKSSNNGDLQEVDITIEDYQTWEVIFTNVNITLDNLDNVTKIAEQYQP